MCERGHTSGPGRGSTSRVGCMRRWSIRRHGRRALLVLSVVLVGFLVGHFGLLPAHSLPAHAALMSQAATETPGAGASQHGRLAVEQSSAHGSGWTASAHADGGHRHDNGAPYCHADPAYTWAAPLRFVAGDWTGLGVLLLLAVGGSALGFPLLSWLRARHRSWSPRPPWRPAGRELLTSVCLSRT